MKVRMKPMQAPKHCLQSLSIFHQLGDFTVKSHESTILIGISDFCKGGTCLGITGKWSLGISLEKLSGREVSFCK